MCIRDSLFTAFTLYVIILLPWWAVALLLLLQGVSFAVYCFAKFLAPFDNANLPVPVLRWDMTLAGVCAFGLLLASAWRYSKRRRSEDYPTPSCAGRSLPR